MKRVLMVCMGNICRSPTAEAVLRHLVARAGLDAEVEVDSAGTHADWHPGEPPDRRSQAHARRRGYDLSGLRARQIEALDFERFDLILAMDWDNLALLEQRCPPRHRSKLKLLGEFPPGSGPVPVRDPYDGQDADFERVLDQIEVACEGLLAAWRGEFLRRP